MMAGMMTVVAGVVAHMAIINTYMRHSPYMRQASVAIIVMGLAIYVVGRVSVASQNRRAKLQERMEGRRGRSADEDDDEL